MKKPNIASWLLIVAPLVAASIAGAQPIIVVTSGTDCARLDSVAFRRCNIPSVSTSAEDKNLRAVGRTYGMIDVHDVAFPNLLEGDEGEAESRRGGYFDIWSLFSETASKEPHAMTLEFTIESRGLKNCYVSLGFNDCCIVFVDRKPIWGVRGSREHCLGQNIVPIPLTNKRSLVSLLIWKAAEWTSVPKNHFENEWAVNVSICPSAEAAWSTYVSNNYHFLDTPIVKTLDDLRFDVALTGRSEVRILDLKGHLITTGKITGEGKLNMDPQSKYPSLPFVGIIMMGDQIAEALVVEGDTAVDDILSKVLEEGTHEVADWGAWKLRCLYLLKPEHLDNRDHWWARKTALSYALAGLQTKFDRTTSPFRFWKSAAIEFRSYQSAIDGTPQHYRALVGPTRDKQSRPLAVYFPGAPMPVRSFLESYCVADINETESLARLADNAGVDLIWPGNVDIDYGGNYTREWVDEALAAFQKDYPAKGYRPIYLVGSCAAGVAALGYAEKFGGVDGLVFWSPIVKRDAYRWPVEDEHRLPLLPPEALAVEATDQGLERIKQLSTFCIFDINVKGHGDREGTKQWCSSFASAGGNVIQRWIPNPDLVMQWGVRATDSEMEWLNWIASDAPETGPRVSRRTHFSSPTIKDVLLKGYQLAQPSSAEACAWVKQWGEMVEQYRGTNPNSKKSEAATLLDVRSVERKEVVSILSEAKKTAVGGLKGFQRGSENDLSGFASIWLVHLKNAQSSVVEVLHSGSSGDTVVPAFDLFREGCCRGVAWGFRNGAWEVLQIWF